MKIQNINTTNGKYLELLAQTVQDESIIEELILTLERGNEKELLDFLTKLNWK